MSLTTDSPLCPSAPVQAGALIIGRFGDDGKLAFLTRRLTVNDAFLEGARDAGIIPEEHYRFSSPCLKKGCAQWSDGSCGIARNLIRHEAHFDGTTSALPACTLRPTCRWFGQEGPRICFICPEIATAQPALQAGGSEDNAELNELHPVTAT